MEPTEHELTVATDEAARHLFARLSNGTQQPSDFDRADPMLRLRYREAVLDVVHDALRALPDRAIAARAEVVRQVQEYCCTCGLAGDAAHEHWCPASAVSDVLPELVEG